MKNTKLYPFERNRYYPGKMLTSADFQAEQAYFNNRQRFMNHLMYGTGVVCGCGVFSLDDLSVLVESGVAIDGLGREIVLESSVVKKLSAVDGFETLKSDTASLCLQYCEEPVHKVYAMNHRAGEDGQEYEYNRISESCRLFLMDQEEGAKEYQMETEFLVSAVLFENDDFAVKMTAPGVVSRGKPVKLELMVYGHCRENRKFTYRGILQIPAFLTPEGGHELEVVLEDISLTDGESVKKDYWLAVEHADITDTCVLVKSGTARAYVDGDAVECRDGASLKIMLSDIKPRQLVSREIGRMSLELKNMSGCRDYVRLADLKLVRTESAYIIEEVMEEQVKTYVASPAQEDLRNEYLEYFIKDGDFLQGGDAPETETERAVQESGRDKMCQTATGTLEIPLGESARKGDIRYSGEIMHGLGRGNVYVDIGYEYIAEDETLQASARNTIYGNPDLFRGEQGADAAVDAETAVRVLNDKGSFIAAARLLKSVDYLVLTYRWIAIKLPAGNDLELEDRGGGGSISTDTPTIVLGTKESHYFQVQYHNMKSCSVAYELTEPGGGEITPDGVYTAPGKEGVYEIRIYCIDMPIICTYAYAIVKKKEA